jgi:hypothetical protein
MNSSRNLLFSLLFASFVASIPVSAQMADSGAKKQRVASSGGTSPHETTSRVIDGSRVILVYGRPFSADPKSGEVRVIWGSLVPNDHWWRLGSDEATLLITQKPIILGGVRVPAGAHSLYLFPSADGSAKLIVNNQIGQWGLQYDESQDLARVDLKREDLPAAVNQFTMAIARNPDGGGLLSLSWEKRKYSVVFTVVNANPAP